MDVPSGMREQVADVLQTFGVPKTDAGVGVRNCPVLTLAAEHAACTVTYLVEPRRSILQCSHPLDQEQNIELARRRQRIPEQGLRALRIPDLRARQQHARIFTLRACRERNRTEPRVHSERRFEMLRRCFPLAAERSEDPKIIRDGPHVDGDVRDHHRPSAVGMK